MGISLSDLKSNVRKITVPYFEDEFYVKYRPAELTPEVESKIRKAAANPDDDKEGNILVTTICNLLTEWEVLDGKGEPLPITYEIVDQMPSAFLSAILNACREDMVPKSKSGRR